MACYLLIAKKYFTGYFGSDVLTLSLSLSFSVWLLICYFLFYRYQGHLLAKELVARGLQTTLITDSAVFAMISRVNMVCLGHFSRLVLDFMKCF